MLKITSNLDIAFRLLKTTWTLKGTDKERLCSPPSVNTEMCQTFSPGFHTGDGQNAKLQTAPHVQETQLLPQQTAAAHQEAHVVEQLHRRETTISPQHSPSCCQIGARISTHLWNVSAGRVLLHPHGFSVDVRREERVSEAGVAFRLLLWV